MAPQFESQPLDTIVQGCREESRLARRQEQGYCFELFRRALEAREGAAWEAIAHQYQRLLLKWVSNGTNLPPESAEVMAAEALHKFWQTLTRQQHPLGSRFSHVGSLLRYLQQCAITTVLDHRRRQQRKTRLAERLQAEAAQVVQLGEPQEALLERLDQAEQLHQVRQWLSEHILDPQEQRILTLSFEFDLSPGEIVARYPTEFPDVREVRRIKERILKRARRAFST